MHSTLGKTMSSRPAAEEGLAVDGLSIHELELIAAFLWITRLGSGISVHRDAAFSLMTKIEQLMGLNFMQDAAIDVDMKINILDLNGNIDRSVGYHFSEIDV